MKKNFLTPLLGFTLVLFLLTSCGKEKDNTPAPKTKTELITTGSWQFDKAMSGSADITTQVPACYKDNVVTFTSSTNGTVTNTLPCTPTDVTPATFMWNFLSSETVLHLSAPLFNGGSQDFNIVTISATALVVSQDVLIPPSSTPINVVFYYRH